MPITLASIKQQLDNKVGESVTVVAQAGRKKVTRRKGKLAETYPSIFVVALDHDDSKYERVSYSYSDLLTKSIQITFDDEEQAS